MMRTQVIDTDVLGRAGRFEEVRRILQSSGYTDEFIRTRIGLNRPEDFEIDRKRRAPLPAPDCPADILMALFLAGEQVPQKEALQLLGVEDLAVLRDMGLLESDAASGKCHATVALYPVEDIYIASDRWSAPDGSRFSVPEDTVYPAFIPNTRLFLRHLPERPGARFLDLCAGTGIAALRAAGRGAGEAWSGDIAERSTRFSEFNRRLNGISNVHVITSDLYEGVKGIRFDVISAHPPYVPTLQPKWIFYSGGNDGEQITRRIIEGLAEHLEYGGYFIALTMGGDRADRSFEQRVREWLGPDQKEFDIAFLLRMKLDPENFALRADRETVRTREESDRWHQFFKKLQIVSLSYGFLCIQRRKCARGAFTIRRQEPVSGSRSPWEWLLRWETAVRGEQLTRLMLDTPLHASSRAEFEILHHLEKGSWYPSRYTLKTDYPFSMECMAEPWMAHMISLCDGRKTGRQVLETLVQNGVIPKATPESEFAQAAASLVSGGFIEVEGFRIPIGGQAT